MTRWRKRCFKSLRSDKDACRHTCNHLSKTEPAANKLGRLSALLQDFVQTPKCIAALTVFRERERRAREEEQLLTLLAGAENINTGEGGREGGREVYKKEKGREDK